MKYNKMLTHSFLHNICTTTLPTSLNYLFSYSILHPISLSLSVHTEQCWKKWRRTKDLQYFQWPTHRTTTRFNFLQNIKTCLYKNRRRTRIINLNVEFSAQRRHCGGSLFKDYMGERGYQAVVIKVSAPISSTQDTCFLLFFQSYNRVKIR